jgi:Protein of unknown function (DUF3052)
LAAGYSGTPLPKKLGIEEGAAVAVIDAPKSYAQLVAPLPKGAKIVTKVPNDAAFVHVFATERDDLSGHLSQLRQTIAQNGVVWVSWPKKGAKVETDITEDVIRDVALPMGFVDVKVCAVDETWSGLKLMIRRDQRR